MIRRLFAGLVNLLLWDETGTFHVRPHRPHRPTMQVVCKGWIARDKNGSLYFHLKKPKKSCFCTWSADSLPTRESFNPMWKLRLPNFESDASWNDKEPIEVEILIRKI